MSENKAGLTIKDYQGGESTLCTGCGHDSITKHIINSYFQSGVHPYQVAKLSGIGCSSKTPAYFMSQSHGFNSIHGRMAAVATGARLANRELRIIGVSGDGDTASIGLGGFIHLLRRNVPMVYIVENNGVYGLTKGQFSATADFEATQKYGDKNPFHTIDLCALAIEVGCGFVARSFSGDAKHLQSLIAAAIRHNGTAFIDVVSPCIAYGNHEGSTRSYDYVKEYKVSLQELGFIHAKDETLLEVQEGEMNMVEMADGSRLTLKKLANAHDLQDRSLATKILREYREKGQIVTGLFLLDKNAQAFEDALQTSKKPLVHMDENELRPNASFLAQVLEDFK